MVFNSYIFILFFLPITLLGYFFANKYSEKLGKYWLIAASLVFYAYAGVKYLGFLIFSIVFNYLIVLAINKTKKETANSKNKKK